MIFIERENHGSRKMVWHPGGSHPSQVAYAWSNNVANMVSSSSLDHCAHPFFRWLKISCVPGVRLQSELAVQLLDLEVTKSDKCQKTRRP